MTLNPFLQPKFDFFASELTQLPRWVLFDVDKRPLRAEPPDSLANIKEPSHWTSFDVAKAAFEAGRYSGVGIVLDGDGLIGFDLDHSVDDGCPDTHALELLEKHNIRYIEYSPSGSGIRAFGYGDPTEFPDWPFKGRRGVIGNIGIEIYAYQRFLTVTGHIICNEGLCRVQELPQLLDKIQAIHLQKTAEDYKSNLLYSSVALLSSSVGGDSIAHLIPASCIPCRHGERHHCLFRLARVLKAKFPDSSYEVCREIVRKWHHLSLSFIRTKEFTISWAEFKVAWEKVKYPMGSTLDSILRGEDVDVTEIAQRFGYGKTMQALLQICLKLQGNSRDAPFFLSVRTAGGLLGIHHTDACRLMGLLVSDGLLDLVSKGSGLKASRYLLNSEALWNT
jgi:hypothetical protein